MRNESGCIILDEYRCINDFVKGRKRKVWLQDQYGNKFLFKMGASNYEIWAELFASEIGRQCGFDIAFYDLGIWNGNVGILTPDFKKKGDLIISGEHVLKQASHVIMENNLNYDICGEQSVEDIILSIGIYTGIPDLTPILKKLIYLWGFDGALMESDRNSTNWSLIQNGQDFDLSTFYDYSTIARMNNNIADLVLGLRNEGDIAQMTDEIQTSLLLQRGQADKNFLQQYRTFCTDFPSEVVDDLVNKLSKIDCDMAFSNLESRINSSKIGTNMVEIPWEVKSWLRRVIGFRSRDMLSIYKNVQKKKEICKGK